MNNKLELSCGTTANQGILVNKKYLFLTIRTNHTHIKFRKIFQGEIK